MRAAMQNRITGREKENITSVNDSTYLKWVDSKVLGGKCKQIYSCTSNDSLWMWFSTETTFSLITGSMTVCKTSDM